MTAIPVRLPRSRRTGRRLLRLVLEPVQRDVADLSERLAGGQTGAPQQTSRADIDPRIGEIFSLEETAAALRAMDEFRAIGRLIVRVRKPQSTPAPRVTSRSSMKSQRRVR